jgi:hypothetical protein
MYQPSRLNPNDRMGNRLEDLRSTWDHSNVTNSNALVNFTELLDPRQSYCGKVVGLKVYWQM